MTLRGIWIKNRKKSRYLNFFTGIQKIFIEKYIMKNISSILSQMICKSKEIHFNMDTLHIQ
jgi:hypothetical protein